MVGVHALGFVGETTAAAEEAFFPGWSHMFTEIGRERGWPPVGRPQFEAMCSPQGAFLVGDPSAVAAKVLRLDEEFGGVSRVTFQMSSASLVPAAMTRSIELLGTAVAPVVREAAARTRRVN